VMTSGALCSRLVPMSTTVTIVTDEETPRPLGAGRLFTPELVIAEFDPAFADLTRARAVFDDGTVVGGDLLRHPADSPSLIGLELDELSLASTEDLTGFELPFGPFDPLGPFDPVDVDRPEVAEMAAVVERVFGRSPSEVAPGTAAPVEAGAPLAAFARVRSPFCWLFPSSRFCR
jgi:hypothetical protein